MLYPGDIIDIRKNSKHKFKAGPEGCIFDEISTTGECVKHSDIEEYKNMDVEMDECFCYSFKDTYPAHCLYCRGSAVF